MRTKLTMYKRMLRSALAASFVAGLGYGVLGSVGGISTGAEAASSLGEISWSTQAVKPAGEISWLSPALATPGEISWNSVPTLAGA
ncbi:MULTISPECIES: hypothetical protein [unclassified Streptomyces]|uniref:hypothetical protein n=1 Tax=unclassified Streptomyces TaxID=2593676 RepID=UPI000DAE676A|nr:MULTISPECIES: hypothetical protein [unclassified Streptomyces]PZT72704.1 hypothetical protein DNK55_29875 [Streptomyces sp. AC1-42T]PZT80977.1 hypothetical protein DNK56_01695 [Streptomyces sp. AC1-42W]